ncbi:hypothetical protein KY290_029977 [Solanum tuberosum]|uniref:Polyprotein n=1 Tax=Solanum tuberosum TaxID=4113 RepID=A0ABQ7UQD9_SOLTU|nr:hypothetical protein KY290_029977 [Solanum tuberosum]
MPNQIVFPIHMHQSHINIPEDKDAYTVSWFLSGFKCEHDWIRQFNQDGRGVQWFNCPFTGHTPWNIDCDCKGCQKDDLDNADRSKSRKMCENSEKEFKTTYDDGDPTIGSLSRPGKYEFLVSYKTQNESALPTRNDNPLSIFDDRSHMPMPFTHVPNDENKFDIAKFVWDQKDAVASQKKTEAALRQSKKKIDLHTRIDSKVVPISSHITPSEDLVFLNSGPSIQHVHLEVSKYDMTPEGHNLIKHGLPDNRGFYDAVEQQSISSVDECPESSVTHIDLTEECSTILDVDEPPQLTKCQQMNKRRTKCHRQARKARMIKLREEESTSIERPNPKAKRVAQLLAYVVEHTSIFTTKEDIVDTEKPPRVTHISHDPESQLKDNLFQTFELKGTASMLNPTVLPNEQWIPHFQNFNTASKGILTTRVITQNLITIEFFPGVQFRPNLLESIIPGTDLIIGFDIYKQLNDRIKVKTQGIAFRDKFKPYTTTTRLFSIIEHERVKNIKFQQVEESCVDSHRGFMKKHNKPLWLNEEFFITFLFNRNENINPTRASLSGMNPKHLQLAKKECDELLEYRLIEPSDSQCDTMEEHFGILHKFHELVKQYGIMLSEKKMILVNDEIDFLGMHFAHGAYIAGPHISEELVKFPDTNFTVKQLHQFLGVINYVRDFIADVSTYISLLTKMLTKKASAWGKDQDDPIRKIKYISKEVKTLHIPSDSLKIMQTAASNEYSNAIL